MFYFGWSFPIALKATYGGGCDIGPCLGKYIGFQSMSLYGGFGSSDVFVWFAFFNG